MQLRSGLKMPKTADNLVENKQLNLGNNDAIQNQNQNTENVNVDSTGSQTDEMSTRESVEENNFLPDRRLCHQELHIVNYDPEGGMSMTSWLGYFNKKCNQIQKDDCWRVQHIADYLKGKALKEYINSCLNITNWQDLCLILVEKFLTPTTSTFGDFSHNKFDIKNNILDYFHQKVDCGRQLGLSTPLLLEGLTDGLPANLRQLMVIHAPNNPTEWLTMATKLIKMQDKPFLENKTFGNSNQQAGQFRNFSHRPRFTPFYEQRQDRPWRPRFQQPTTQTFQNSSNPEFSRGRASSFRFDNPRPQKFNVHSQSQLPPSPCRLCTRQGILNAYHWVQTCPFRNPTKCFNLPEQSDLSETQIPDSEANQDSTT